MSQRLSNLLRRELESDPLITGVTADSRRVKPGYLFAALPGVSVDGAAFAAAAVAAGPMQAAGGAGLGGGVSSEVRPMSHRKPMRR